MNAWQIITLLIAVFYLGMIIGSLIEKHPRTQISKPNGKRKNKYS